MHLLIVDDDTALLEALSVALSHRIPDATITTAASGQEGLRHLENQSFDVVLTDLLMGGLRGDELAEKISAQAHRIPVILITGVPEKPGETLPIPMVKVFRKPFDVNELAEYVRAIVAKGGP